MKSLEPKNYLSLASFLINKSIYSDEEGRSLIEGGKILETAYGNAWALDFIGEELPSKGGEDLMETATLERFVTEEAEKTPDGFPEKYRRKMGEVLQGVVNHYRGINVPVAGILFI